MFRFYSKATETNNVRVAVVGEHTEGVLKIAISRCSDKDSYVKKVGRQLAEDRLKEGNLYTSINIPEVDVKTFVLLAKGIASDVARDPRRVITKKS